MSRIVNEIYCLEDPVELWGYRIEMDSGIVRYGVETVQELLKEGKLVDSGFRYPGKFLLPRDFPGDEHGRFEESECWSLENIMSKLSSESTYILIPVFEEWLRELVREHWGVIKNYYVCENLTVLNDSSLFLSIPVVGKQMNIVYDELSKLPLPVYAYQFGECVLKTCEFHHIHLLYKRKTNMLTRLNWLRSKQPDLFDEKGRPKSELKCPTFYEIPTQGVEPCDISRGLRSIICAECWSKPYAPRQKLIKCKTEEELKQFCEKHSLSNFEMLKEELKYEGKITFTVSGDSIGRLVK